MLSFHSSLHWHDDKFSQGHCCFVCRISLVLAAVLYPFNLVTDINKDKKKIEEGDVQNHGHSV